MAVQELPVRRLQVQRAMRQERHLPQTLPILLVPQLLR
jgi:hypothetical protein